VDAEPAGFWHRIDQPRERRPRAAAEIVSFGEIGRWDQFDRHAVDAARDRRRGEPRGIDQQSAFKRHRRLAAGLDLDRLRTDLGAQ
jgi:hypothetical protein